jgi:S-DNA-T family DNA segregation ATPase FtsK/SpoIIIE
MPQAPLQQSLSPWGTPAPQPQPYNSFSQYAQPMQPLPPTPLQQPTYSQTPTFFNQPKSPITPVPEYGFDINTAPVPRARVRAGAEQMGMPISTAPKVYIPRQYIKPTIDLIRTESSDLNEFRADAMDKQRLLDIKLKEFGVNAKVTSFTVAPAVTRFEVQLGSVTRVSQVEQLSKDIAYVLGSPNVRMESTIAGKSAIGIEVPNASVGKVSIKDIILSREFQQHKSPLAVAIGKNLNDEAVIGDISSMPHLLIAGSTNSGKSVCINTILTSLLFRAHPDEVKLLLVDMKRVELNIYNDIPHMLIPRTIKDVTQVINALKWLETEMRRRYDVLESNSVNNIGLYHALPAYVKGTLERMPYIVMVIDEAADLIAKGKKEVEESIKSLSSLARACGIHIILATQRPSVDVITSVIKTNFTVRIAFKVSSRFDSVTIINNAGAEKLVGRGDMLFLKEGADQRVQGAFIEREETSRIMNFIRENNESDYDPQIEDIILNGPPNDNNAANGFGDADGIRPQREQDPYFVPVLKWLVRDDNIARIASISGMQRQFGVGFARAGKIMDQLAAAGYVSSANGTKTREVLVTREQVESIYGE